MSTIDTLCIECGYRRGLHQMDPRHCPVDENYSGFRYTVFTPVQDTPSKEAKRFNTGKAQLGLNLLGKEVQECEASIWEMGMEKYGRGNWLKGQQLSTCMDSVLRHATAIMNGEFIDEESGKPHVGHLITASKIAAHSYLTKPELNDIKEIIGEDTNVKKDS